MNLKAGIKTSEFWLALGGLFLPGAAATVDAHVAPESYIGVAAYIVLRLILKIVAAKRRIDA